MLSFTKKASILSDDPIEFLNIYINKNGTEICMFLQRRDQLTKVISTMKCHMWIYKLDYRSDFLKFIINLALNRGVWNKWGNWDFTSSNIIVCISGRCYENIGVASEHRFDILSLLSSWPMFSKVFKHICNFKQVSKQTCFKVEAFYLTDALIKARLVKVRKATQQAKWQNPTSLALIRKKN